MSNALEMSSKVLPEPWSAANCPVAVEEGLIWTGDGTLLRSLITIFFPSDFPHRGGDRGYGDCEENIHGHPCFMVGQWGDASFLASCILLILSSFSFTKVLARHVLALKDPRHGGGAGLGEAGGQAGRLCQTSQRCLSSAHPAPQPPHGPGRCLQLQALFAEALFTSQPIFPNRTGHLTILTYCYWGGRGACRGRWA